MFSSASAATSSSSVLGGGDDSANASGDESETKTKAEVPKSFGERLRAEKDFVEREDDEEGGMNGYEQKVDLTEQEGMFSAFESCQQYRLMSFIPLQWSLEKKTKIRFIKFVGSSLP